MTKNRVVFALSVCVAAALTAMFPGRMTVAVDCGLALVWLFSLVQFRVALRRFSVCQTLDHATVQKGQQAQLQLDVAAWGGLGLLAEFCFSDESALLCDELTRIQVTLSKQNQFCYTLSCPYRGRFTVGLNQVKLYDLLGLFCAVRQAAPLTLKIYPQRVALRRFGSAQGQQPGQQARDLLSQTDYTEVTSLRGYQPTDNRKDIHWKASAKRGELLVKQYGLLNSESATLVLDLAPNGYETVKNLALEDRMIGAAVAVADVLLRSAQSVQLVYGTQAAHWSGLQDSAAQLIETLSFLPFGSAIPAAELLRRTEQVGNHGRMVIFTHNLDEPLCRQILSQHTRQISCSVLYFSCEEDPAAAEKAKRLQRFPPTIPWVQIGQADNLQAKLEAGI